LIIAATVCGLFLSYAGAAAEEPARPPDQPIWTLVPTHIDRTTDHRERLQPVAPADGRFSVSLDRPIRLGEDGSFSIAGKPARIFGIAMPDRRKLCQIPAGPRWTCGVRAHIALTAMLSGQVLRCKRLNPPDAAVAEVNCLSGNADIAEHMVGEGWATADAVSGDRLKALEAEARKADRGQWRVALPGF
jgi:hypothetical protein